MSQYRDFLNYLYNELGVSKEDIKTWTKEAITEVANEYIQHNLSPNTIDNIVRRYLETGEGVYWSRDALRQEIARRISQQIEVQVKINNAN